MSAIVRNAWPPEDEQSFFRQTFLDRRHGFAPGFLCSLCGHAALAFCLLPLMNLIDAITIREPARVYSAQPLLVYIPHRVYFRPDASAAVAPGRDARRAAQALRPASTPPRPSP